ncbi:PEP/pyruvate-binding domain-containing protein [Bacillus bombysepticus]|uniref:PEP/pyruvate-binding domain-containing protein n=1 Tax=Bacillus bombysepticus TaxID=658666 RepID=UPI0030185FF9
MFLWDANTEQEIIDYQLIYDTDSNLQLEFYADGLTKESLLFSNTSPFTKIDYGLLVANPNRWEEYEKLLVNEITKTEIREKITTQMVLSIKNVHNWCRKIERQLKNESYSKNNHLDNWKSFYNSVVHMMSFKRLSDIFQEQWSHLAQSITLPSYMDQLHQSLYHLKKNPTKNSIEKFLWYTGFLLTFNIEKTELEHQDGIEKWLAKDWNTRTSLRRTAPSSLEEKWMKRVGWYEELRHYYQLRALRNFRLLFEELNIDIHKGTMADIEEEVLCKEVYKMTPKEKYETTIFGEGPHPKFHNLSVLASHGIRVPSSYLLTDLKDINNAWENMKQYAPLAVRSSMLGEDSANKSYAGHFDTILCINTKEDFNDAINQVWASAQDMIPGILIQPMVYSKISGILFSKSPLLPSSMMIESIYGLGEPLVSGQISPDRITIDRTTGAITKKDISLSKNFGLFLHSGAKIGDTLEDYKEARYSFGSSVKCLASIPFSMRKTSSLNELQTIELFNVAMEIESIFGAPQDIEWAWDNQGLIILQSRPITTTLKEVETSKHTNSEWKGTIASIGEVSGLAIEATNREGIEKAIQSNQPYIVIARETSPEMIYELSHASGIITETGSTLCHAAIVSREWDIPCIVNVPSALNLYNKQILLRSIPSEDDPTIGEVILL